MPCVADPMPSNLDMEAHKLRIFHEELTTMRPYNELVHIREAPIYPENTTEKEVNDLTAHLCKRMSNTCEGRCSLELQIWWRDHQESDRKRNRS